MRFSLLLLLLLFFFVFVFCFSVGKESDGAPKPSSSNVTKPDTRQSRRPLSSFKRTWNRWADETTLHGIKFVFDDGSSIVRR